VIHEACHAIHVCDMSPCLARMIHMNDPRQTHWHVTHMNDMPTHMNDSHQTQWHVTHMNDSRDMTHLHVCHTFHVTLMNDSRWACEKLMAHVNESCNTYVWVKPHAYERVWMSHATRVNESCQTYAWVMSNIYMRVMSYVWTVCVKIFLIPHVCVMSHIWISHVTHLNESCHTHECVMSHVWII